MIAASIAIVFLGQDHRLRRPARPGYEIQRIEFRRHPYGCQRALFEPIGPASARIWLTTGGARLIQPRARMAAGNDALPTGRHGPARRFQPRRGLATLYG